MELLRAAYRPTTMHIGNRLFISASLAMLTGCASLANVPPGETRQCMPQETLVCYGKSASKLDKPHDGPAFCRCEDALNRL